MSPKRMAEPVHWVGDAPTSLHGNGATSFNHTTRESAKATCALCRTLLARAEPPALPVQLAPPTHSTPDDGRDE